MNSKAKIGITGILMIMGGGVLIVLFVFGHIIRGQKTPGPTEVATGYVIRYQPGYRSGSRRESSSCTYAYKIKERTHTISDTCGANILGLEDRDGDRVDIVYSIEDPEKAAVKRNGFFNLLGIVGLCSAGIGFLLVRKANRMFDDYLVDS